MKRNRTILGVALVLAVLGTSAGDFGTTSEKFSFATYREQQGRVTMIVDTFHASLHDADEYIPIPLAIGVRGRGPQLVITPESFTLIDGEGKAYPAAAFGELVENYGKLTFDRTVLRQRPLVVGQQFELSLRLDSRFYPANDEGTRIPRVNLARGTWLSDVIYFPRPAGGLDGVLTLKFEGKGIGDPVLVRFEVPVKRRSRA